MNAYYRDILSRIPEPPLWWDENAVPRWCEFSPDEVANIYADEVCLVRITCQDCGAEFRVGFSSTIYGRIVHGSHPPVFRPTLEERAAMKSLHYGDPPGHGCVGDTMNSEPREVLEFWHRNPARYKKTEDGRIPPEWIRRNDLEVEITPEWVGKC